MKTRTIWLAALALLAILFISGTVFAEGEVPEGPRPKCRRPAAEEPPLCQMNRQLRSKRRRPRERRRPRPNR